jgi:hypothetical protein
MQVRVGVWSHEEVGTVVSQALCEFAARSARHGVIPERRSRVFDKSWLGGFFLKCNGTLAERNRTLEECGIRPNATIDVVVRKFLIFFFFDCCVVRKVFMSFIVKI